MVNVKGTSNKGIFFSLDAVLALVAALAIVGSLGLYYTVSPELEYKTSTPRQKIYVLLSTQRPKMWMSWKAT